MSASSQYPSGFFAAPKRQQDALPPPPPPPPGAMYHQQQQPCMYSYSYSHNAHQQQQNQYNHAVFHGRLVDSTLARGYNLPTPASVAAVPKEQEFKCKACDLALDSASALASHRKSHIQCKECSFKAAPKVVKGHHDAVHGKYSGSGFKTVTIAVPGCKVRRFQICVGNRPEDIQRWIAERRKRFPRSKKTRLPERAATNESIDKQAASDDKQQTGLSSLLAGYGSSSSSEEEDGEVDGKQVSIEMEAISAISSSPEVSRDNAERTETASYRTRPCRFFMRNGICRNGDNCNFSHECPVREDSWVGNKKRKMNYGTPKKSLLQKLLANEAKRETALTLQLLEYIVDSKFLQEEGRKT